MLQYKTLIVDEKCCLYVARFACDDAQLDHVADRREHVTCGHVVSQVLAAADAGVDRVGALLDDGVSPCGASTRVR